MMADIVPETFAPGYVPGRGEFWRWAGSIAVALAVHVTAVLGLVDWDEPVSGAERPSITVDLVPFLNPLAELRDDAPGPLHQQSEPQSQPAADEQPVEKTDHAEVAPDGEQVPRQPVK